MISGIHHVSIIISSERCLDFYKLLGFNEIYRRKRKSDTVVLLDGFCLQLEVFVDCRHPVRTLDIHEPLGPRHFAMKVSGDIEAELKRLREICIEQMQYDPLIEPLSSDWIGEKYAFFGDPDGNIIEFHE